MERIKIFDRRDFSIRARQGVQYTEEIMAKVLERLTQRFSLSKPSVAEVVHKNSPLPKSDFFSLNTVLAHMYPTDRQLVMTNASVQSNFAVIAGDWDFTGDSALVPDPNTGVIRDLERVNEFGRILTRVSDWNGSSISQGAQNQARFEMCGFKHVETVSFDNRPLDNYAAELRERARRMLLEMKTRFGCPEYARQLEDWLEDTKDTRLMCYAVPFNVTIGFKQLPPPEL